MRKFAIYTVLLTVTIILGLSACQKSQFQSMPSPLMTNLATPTFLPSPQLGRAHLMGQVVSKVTNMPLREVPVRLARVYREGSEAIFVLDAAFSPGGVTGEDGYFIIQNIDPGEYVIVIGNPEGLYEIISEPSGEARVWRLMPDQVIDTGVLCVGILP
ncbi:MAG: hypothetical protein ACPL7A_00085 [Anaerolineales bacterium]